jgi:hypothetical protein
MFGLVLIIALTVLVKMAQLHVQKNFALFYNVNLYVNKDLFFPILFLSFVDTSRMKKLFVYPTVVVQYVPIDICADFMAIKVIKSIMNMIYGIHQHVNIVPVDVIIVLYVKVFNVNINFVLIMKFKKHDRIVVVFRVDKQNNVIYMVIFLK